MNLIAVSINHRTAPVDLREAVFLSEDEIRAVTKKAKEELSPKEMRLKIAEESKKKDPVKKEKEKREEFRTYFIRLKRKLNLDAYLEDIIWLHFKAAGFDEKEKFDDGVRHFGYKI